MAKTPVSPEQVSQIARAVKAKYDAAGRGKRMAGWQPTSSGPNTAMVGLQTIRDRSRDASRNDWSGEASIQKWTTNLIGIGITPRFRRILNKARKQFITDLFNDFVAQADADGVLNLHGLYTLGTRSWLESGEVFARRRPRSLNEGLAVPLQIQLIEADMVPLLDADTYVGMPAGNTIRSGIERNNRGKRIAYWVYKEHPGDANRGGSIDPFTLVRVMAADMCHVFEPKRPGQLRGVPAMAPVLPKLRDINDYENVTLERQKLANLIVGFISRTLPTLDAGGTDIDPLSGLPLEGLDAAASPLVGLTPGLIQELEDGQKVEWSNPPEAGTTYSDYMRTGHMGTAAAVGLPYEIFSGDIRNVSDRTLRVLINDFRRFAEQRQWQIIIPMLCQPVIEWFAEAALLAGKITIDELDSVRRVEHAPHGWQYIHPVQDPQGKKIEVDAGFRSRSSVIGERGDDPDLVDDERQLDDEREQALAIGLYSESLKVPEPVQPVPSAPVDPAAPEQAKPAPSALEAAQIKLLQAQAHATMRSGPEPAPPVTNVTIHQPANTINLPAPVVNMEPAAVHVQNVVEAQQAPVVNITNEVLPAPVTVNNAFASKAVQTVERDANDEIVSTTTTYTP
jgi:lambda family phage portal protein